MRYLSSYALTKNLMVMKAKIQLTHEYIFILNVNGYRQVRETQKWYSVME